ncbi:MAG: ATP-binding protein, partial [Pseudomonadota bacterium]
GSNDELLRATENLTESEQRYRSLFETSSIPTLLVDIESGSIRDLNAPAAALCGAAPDQLIGTAAWDLSTDWLSRAIGQRTSLTDASLCVHESWVSETGEQSFADIWLTPVSLDGDASALVTVHDTTEERRFENERIRTGKLESLGVLAGGIAHDFNNALAVVMGYVNLARNAMDENANATALLTAAEKSIDHCAKLTADLQAFAKGGQPQLELHDMRLRLTEAVRMATAGSDSDVVLNVDDALWNAEVDASQFKQMISSLVLNGLQAMPEGGQLTVTAANVRAQDPVGPVAGPGDYLRFDVADSGTGIPLEIQDNVLDPYFSTRTGSTGLGLTSAFAIATRHGGWLEFMSVEGEGSTFSVWLPALRDAVTSPAALPVFMRRGSERVLVMDDNESVQMMYAAALHKLGYNADIVADGQTAIAHYAKRMGSETAYDLVVLDLTVPGGMGGKDTMAALQRLDPEVLAIVASGYSADPVMAEYQAHGFAASLRKPFSLDEMSVALRRVLDAG